MSTSPPNIVNETQLLSDTIVQIPANMPENDEESGLIRITTEMGGDPNNIVWN